MYFSTPMAWFGLWLLYVHLNHHLKFGSASCLKFIIIWHSLIELAALSLGNEPEMFWTARIIPITVHFVVAAVVAFIIVLVVAVAFVSVLRKLIGLPC